MAGLYIHIPFCQKRCIYCDFYSTVALSKRAAYTQALCREMEARAEYLHGETLETVYFGGGTPSLLSHDQLSDIFQAISSVFSLSPDAEITLEVNPDDVTDTFALQLAQLPVNRVSMGIQTFNDHLLSLLGRRHTAIQAVEAVSRLRQCGTRNLSLDLIYGLPGQSLGAWENDITQVLQRLHPEHLSAYALIYEEGTRLWQLRQQGQVTEADEELSLEMYSLLMDKAKEAGYEHYEISNFALPGWRSRHNSSYWADIPYLGCGPSAHSYDGRSRQWNKANLNAYIAADGNAVSEREELTPAIRHNEMLLKRLRTSDGLSMPLFSSTFGQTLAERFLKLARPHFEKGTLLYDEAQQKVHLSRSGLFISDSIISDLFLEDS